MQEYSARTIGVDFEGAAEFADRNMRWIQCLAARLNVGDLDVIPLARERGEGRVAEKSLGGPLHGCRGGIRRDGFGLGRPDVAVNDGRE